MLNIVRDRSAVGRTAHFTAFTCPLPPLSARVTSAHKHTHGKYKKARTDKRKSSSWSVLQFATDFPRTRTHGRAISLYLSISLYHSPQRLVTQRPPSAVRRLRDCCYCSQQYISLYLTCCSMGSTHFPSTFVVLYFLLVISSLFLFVDGLAYCVALCTPFMLVSNVLIHTSLIIL